jgi:hypothetical protein
MEIGRRSSNRRAKKGVGGWVCLFSDRCNGIEADGGRRGCGSERFIFSRSPVEVVVISFVVEQEEG